MDYKKPPPELTLKAFYALPTRSPLEVYVTGTGLWVPARVVHTLVHSCVTPEDDGLAVLHEVIILDEMPDYIKEVKLKFVRLPHPKGRMLEPGPYRDVLERCAIDLVAMLRGRETTEGVPSSSYEQLRESLRNLLTTGGFKADLWHALEAVLQDAFKPKEDDPLMRILEDIKRG